MATKKYKKISIWLEPKHIRFIAKNSKKNKESRSSYLRKLITVYDTDN